MPRLEPPETLRVEILTSPALVRLCNLSQEGFLVAAVVPFQPGSRHNFRFMTDNWSSKIMRAVAIHTKRDKQQTSSFVTGFAFLDAADAAAELVDRVTSTLTFL